MEGCKSCGATVTEPVKNDLGLDLYWLGTPKDTTDFVFLVPDENEPMGFRQTFLGIHHAPFPLDMFAKYDFYCPECFIKISQEQEQTETEDDGH